MPNWLRRAPFMALVLAMGIASTAIRSASAGPPSQGGFFAFSGEDARTYRLPADVILVDTFSGADLTFERYQQVAGPRSASVLGAQITLVSAHDDGARRMVAGSHFPHIQPSNAVAVTPDQAKGAASKKAGGGDQSAELVIDPTTHRHLYQVETRREDARVFTFVDAQTGEVVDSFDAIMDDHNPFANCGSIILKPPPCGNGVAFDRGNPSDVKDLTGLTSTSVGSPHRASSPDGRQVIYDKSFSSSAIATDDDDAWTLIGDASPAQQAITDAMYYTNITDDMLLGWLEFDFVAKRGGPFNTIAHYSTSYSNAFWNGTGAFFGDGDQVSFREFTPLDVVAHEFSHGVTDLTSDLVYRDQPGALNESFSDIMGNTAEWFAQGALRESPGFAADFLVGEDLDLRTDVQPGFRNMGDPEEDGDPDHFSELRKGNTDNGFVHSNSGIPNHAFFLLSMGGQNASCVSPAHNSAHCSDSDTQDQVSVSGIGVQRAADVFFTGFSALSQRATMCNARTATVAAAKGLYGETSPEAVSTNAAWLAVGLTDKACQAKKGGPKR